MNVYTIRFLYALPPITLLNPNLFQVQKKIPVKRVVEVEAYREVTETYMEKVEKPAVCNTIHYTTTTMRIMSCKS